MTQSFDAAMEAFAPALPLAVGLSGGADSTALLLACAGRWPGQVHAFHVHHGLQAAADGFERHCADLCQRQGVPLQVARVNARPAPGQSPEDIARRMRYEAFAGLAQVTLRHDAIKTIALAQHADDQAETLLLALSRGAGVPGLASMPAHWQRDGLDWHRPLLRVAGADVRAWLVARGEAWVEDPTNRDEHYTRNRIRHRLLPALDAAFPQFRDTFARSAEHAAQASELLQELAEADLAAVGVPPRLAALQALSRARQANVLRHWLRRVHGTTPAAAQLAELLDQIAACTTRGHRIRIKVGRGFAVREAQVLGWYNS
ncbi:tRNA lysidine(34) synthetase TilS [Acidovorax sp. SUPP2522]|uniref:tRNA lysidine(34) synthetase TilS n=1 Tax=unclassified Acidovorax TaxID=2684926 RepID=UPI0023498262|nr:MULTISPECIES: tRNA lysidine(34) synthetase TilS [unclassified Acidovorax]WCM95821.1 tRNA lysidine(34) synthetase TilS [Acidovorax sp. GBBC 1281]GKT14625.1 tRNA lysidine(34) synthetase TilS [Acidovorax sp. SUPP2522]